MTLRTFHAGGTAANIAANASIVAKNDSRLEFEELRTVDSVEETGEAVKIVVGRLAEVRFIDVNTGIVFLHIMFLMVLNFMLLMVKSLKRVSLLPSGTPSMLLLHRSNR